MAIKGLIGQFPDPPQQMVGRDPLLNRLAGKQRAAALSLTAHLRWAVDPYRRGGWFFSELRNNALGLFHLDHYAAMVQGRVGSDPMKSPALWNLLIGSGRRPLRKQLSITLSAIFALSVLASILMLNQLFAMEARDLIGQRSRFFMDAMLAVREYTSKNINPIVAPLNNGGGAFRPESVPSYSAQAVFANLRGKDDYKDYSYREAALNPTNLRDKADTFEANVIERFRSDPSLRELAGKRLTPLGSMHFVARPIKVGKESCLVCHSTPDRAPASQLLTYGDSNGFGWKLDEIVGAQIVTVPQKAVFEAKNRSLMANALMFLLVFVVVGVITNATLDRLILRPMRQISLKADEASVTPATVSFDERIRGDEIGLLARSFERMKQSLAISMQMLKDRQGRS